MVKKAPLILLVLGSLNLGLTLYVHTLFKTRAVLIVDPKRDAVLWATPKQEDRQRDISSALKEALRVEFGWGRFRKQDGLKPFHLAYWDGIQVDGGCNRLYDKDFEIQTIVWGGNYALIHFSNNSEILQVNLRGMRKVMASAENPTGWRFQGWLTLVEGGISL